MFKFFRSKDTVFFDLFDNIADRVLAAAKHLNKLTQDFPRIDAALQMIRNEEHEADNLCHAALDRLDRAFLPPFDREDIHTLVKELDDIVDAIDALVKRMPLFHVKAIPSGFVRQTEILLAATQAVDEAVSRLRNTKKLSQLSDKLIEIHHQESVGDDNHHAALSELFSGDIDPLEVMKWKELYDYIEDAIDGCEDVGNTLERIVLKNS